MGNPQTLSLEALKDAAARSVVWTSPRLAQFVGRELAVIPLCFPEEPPLSTPSLVVIGGGGLLDAAKIWRCHQSPGSHLIAVASVWGSGADASPVAVTRPDACGHKHVFVGPQYLPNGRAVWPELATSVGEDQARWGSGDVWAHALEGFCSPLATDELRGELAALIQELVGHPLDKDPAWFEFSARASALQARASVGLVHGIAHTLEGPLGEAFGRGAAMGHARICASYLLPVYRFNRSVGSKIPALFSAHGICGDAVEARLVELFDQSFYRQSLRLLEEHWRRVIRDPSSRTNCALVRPGALSFFLQGFP